MPQARWFHRKLTKYIFFRKLLIGSFLSLLYVDTWKKWCILSLVALVVRPGWYLLAFASIHLCVFVHTQDLESACDDAEQFVILLYSMLTYVCVPVSACTILVYWSSCVMWAKKNYKHGRFCVFAYLYLCICGRRQCLCMYTTIVSHNLWQTRPYMSQPRHAQPPTPQLIWTQQYL